MTDHDLLARVGELLAARGRGDDFCAEQRSYQIDFDDNNGGFVVVAVRVPADVDLLLCYSLYPNDVTVELQACASELVTRLNYGLRLGSFELSLDHGQLRFRSSLDLRGIELTERLLENVLMASINGMIRYLPSIRAVLEEGTSPADAIALVDGASVGG